jgi:hypothetical protein
MFIGESGLREFVEAPSGNCYEIVGFDGECPVLGNGIYKKVDMNGEIYISVSDTQNHEEPSYV